MVATPDAPDRTAFKRGLAVVVGWTDPDPRHASWSALVRQLPDGKWRVTECKTSATLDGH